MLKKPIYLITCLLGLIALLYHLGVSNIFLGVDEATRAIVSWEMMLSGNYWTPTINGEFYYKKPPLYNWILSLFFKLFGYNNFVLRVPNVLALTAFSYSIYFFNKDKIERHHAIVLGLMIVSCGRILLWESYFGYIDILFSTIVYTSLMLIFHFHSKERYWQLFVISYALTFCAFMLKGLPAVVFQGITLLALMVWKRKWKLLFGYQHIAGILLFGSLLSLYYYAYSQHNSLNEIWSRLWEESSKRTATNASILTSIKHVFSFPFEMIYHYIPWTLFLPFLFTKTGRSFIQNNEYVKYCLIIFMSNLIIYWVSPNVYPKYILMLVPLIYTAAFLSFLEHEFKMKRYIVYFFLGLIVAINLIPIVFYFIPQFSNVDQLTLKCILAFIILSTLSYFALNNKKEVLIVLICSLFVFKFMFTDFIWEKRDDRLSKFENDALRIKEITKDEKVFYLNWQPVQHANTFKLSYLKKQIVGIERDDPLSGIFYIAKEKNLSREGFEVYYRYEDVQKKEKLALIKFQ